MNSEFFGILAIAGDICIFGVVVYDLTKNKPRGALICLVSFAALSYYIWEHRIVQKAIQPRQPPGVVVRNELGGSSPDAPEPSRATTGQPPRPTAVSKTLPVVPPPVRPIASLSAEPSMIEQGQSSTLSWTSQDATEVNLEPGFGQVHPDGSHAVTPNQTTRYTLSVSGPGGSNSSEATVIVNVPPPEVSFVAEPEKLVRGESTILKWSSQHATQLRLDPGFGQVEADGFRTVSPQESTTYVITVTGPGGVKEFSCSVTVLPSPFQSGVIIWFGNVGKDGLIEIDGSNSLVGTVLQGGLPGVPVNISVDTNILAVAEGPGPSNGWKRIILRCRKRIRSQVYITWWTDQGGSQ